MRIPRVYLLLWALCLIGSWSVLPYVYYLKALPEADTFGKIFLFGTIQSAILFGIICWISSKVVPKTDLSPFAADHPRNRILYPALIFGTIVGLIIVILDKTVFASSALVGTEVHPPMWMGALASLYGGVNEEVLLRLFLFSLIYWLFSKLLKHRVAVFWSSNILVALIFGIGHLPIAFKMLENVSLFEINRILLLNGIAGVTYGWLYKNRGLWTAMGAHFITDLIIHVFFIF